MKRQIETKRLLRFMRDAAAPAGLGIALGIVIFLAATAQSRPSDASAAQTREATPAPVTPLRAVRERTGPGRAPPFRNCSAARAAGAAPVLRGQPGYGEHLDRDGDGVGCEPYPH